MLLSFAFVASIAMPFVGSSTETYHAPQVEEQKMEVIEIPSGLDQDQYFFIREVFGTSTAKMLPIAKCESEYRQFKNGKVLRGVENKGDLGFWQIHEPVWGESAAKLGHNIYTFEGNTRMAKVIYDLEGVRPWVCSRKK